MFRIVIGALGAFAMALPAMAQVQGFPASFRTQDVQTNGATIHVRVGGQGPAVVLLHGFGDTGDMWAPLAADLARDHTVVVPDLRGMGLSSHPEGGYDKRTQAADISLWLPSCFTSPQSKKFMPVTKLILFFGHGRVCTRCGIIGANIRPNWRERPERKTLTGAQRAEFRGPVEAARDEAVCVARALFRYFGGD